MAIHFLQLDSIDQGDALRKLNKTYESIRWIYLLCRLIPSKEFELLAISLAS